MRATVGEARPGLVPVFRNYVFSALPAALVCTSVLAVVGISFHSHLRAYEAFSLRIERSSSLDMIQNRDFPEAALVTLSDESFLNCSLQFVRAAREIGRWRAPIFLLTSGLDEANGTIAHPEQVASILSEMQNSLGVLLVPTSGALDQWAGRRLSSTKLRKMDIFFNPLFRTFDRIIYMDPDGTIKAPLAPLIAMAIPFGVSIVMRQNDESLGKGRLWSRTNGEFLLEKEGTAKTREMLSADAPDRQKVGGSCWFIAEMGRMRSVKSLLEESRAALCHYRDIFRYNDQTLLNVIFYNEMELFPWCVSREVPVIAGGSSELRKYCQREMRVQRWLDKGLRFIYRHCSVDEKRNCLGRGGLDAKDGRKAGTNDKSDRCMIKI